MTVTLKMRMIAVVVVIVVVRVGGGWCLPAHHAHTQTHAHTPAPAIHTSAPVTNTRAPATPLVLEKTLANVKVQVYNPKEGEYGVDIFRQGGGRLDSQSITVPSDWSPPGLEDSRLLHVERLDSGDAVIVYYSLENGLDLVYVPKNLFQRAEATPVPISATAAPLVLEKTLANVKVQVYSPKEGEYGVDIFRQGNGQGRLSSQSINIPSDWSPPGLEDSRLLHVEMLDSGDAVIVYFSLENGLDLVYVPRDLFRSGDSAPSLQTIIFPDSTVTSPRPWTSYSPGGETVTQPSKIRPRPEKTISVPVVVAE